jgi:hypothetical protein
MTFGEQYIAVPLLCLLETQVARTPAPGAVMFEDAELAR